MLYIYYDVCVEAYVSYGYLSLFGQIFIVKTVWGSDGCFSLKTACAV